MSLNQFYVGRKILDYTGKLANVEIRIDQDQSELASEAIDDVCSLLSNGIQLVETGRYTDYRIVQNYPSPSSVIYNCFRLTMVDVFEYAAPAAAFGDPLVPF